METEFILHGGCTSVENESNKLFFGEFTKKLDSGDRILYVAFARESIKDQQEVFDRDKAKILSSTAANLDIELANLEDFSFQLEKANGVFVTGGITKILKDRILTHSDFAKSLRGKIYAGSSAGANVLSAYHTSSLKEGVLEGLGILPICLMAHYGNPEYNGIKENEHWFDEYLDNLQLVALPECEWETLKVQL